MWSMDQRLKRRQKNEYTHHPPLPPPFLPHVVRFISASMPLSATGRSGKKPRLCPTALFRTPNPSCTRTLFVLTNISSAPPPLLGCGRLYRIGTTKRRITRTRRDVARHLFACPRRNMRLNLKCRPRLLARDMPSPCLPPPPVTQSRPVDCA